jgi:molecular chaperone HscB
MIYFELFEIPVQLKVNTAALSQKFFALSKKFHPDYYANEPEAVQTDMLEQSALLNKAWKTFQQPDATIKYVLQEKGLLEEEEKYVLAPAFLMEVMDINEALMDAGGDTEAMNELKIKIAQLQQEIYEPVTKIVENYKEGTSSEKELLQVKEWYYQKKYLDRIDEQLAGMV